MTRTPFVTLFLCALTGALALLPTPLHEMLYFDINQIVAGQWLGLISGHWMHAGTEHLLWNVSALAIIGAVIESCSRRLLLWSLVAGMASVDLLLVSPLADIGRYCGLSGLLNTLLGVMLYLLWQRTRSKIVIGVGALCVLKIAVEVTMAQSLFTSTQWPPYALAHLAGMAGTPIALVFANAGMRSWLSLQHAGTKMVKEFGWVLDRQVARKGDFL